MMYFPPPRQRKFQTMERWFRFSPPKGLFRTKEIWLLFPSILKLFRTKEKRRVFHTPLLTFSRRKMHSIFAHSRIIFRKLLPGLLTMALSCFPDLKAILSEGRILDYFVVAVRQAANLTTKAILPCCRFSVKEIRSRTLVCTCHRRKDSAQQVQRRLRE